MDHVRASRLLAAGFAAAWFLEAYMMLSAWWFSRPPDFLTASLGAFLALAQGCKWLDTLQVLLERRR